MSKSLSSILLAGAMIIGISGCSSKESVKPKPKTTIVKLKRPKAYTFNYIPIIGTQTPDDKVIVDMGVVLRVWVNSYKNRSNTLVSSHDLYIWAKKPDFIAGNVLPAKSRGLLTPQHKMPFMLSDNSVDRSNFKDNKNIRNFVNSVYKQKTTPVAAKENLHKASKNDIAIKNFIKKITNKKENKKNEK
ncbi:hypothetical protein [Sulfurimonas indica]|uniref:hypothetical protein n=1 Tax=Sulfurimonas TaxID=202746 RepID=UPI001262D58C|nr:hypothetical protein [Sulfurimonas indica]